MKQQTQVLYQAAAADGIAHIHMLWATSVRLTHRKDELVDRLASHWGVSPHALYPCPPGRGAPFFG